MGAFHNAPMATSAQIRQQLVDALELDLIGPGWDTWGDYAPPEQGSDDTCWSREPWWQWHRNSRLIDTVYADDYNRDVRSL